MTSNLGIIASGVGDDFDPLAEIAWAKAFWASDPSWVNPGDGGAVSTWRNGGSVAGDAVQAVALSQPTFRSSVAALNSKAGVEFDGTADFVSTAAFAAISQPFSTICIFSWVGGTGANDTIHIYRPVAGGNGAVSRQDSSSAWRYNPGTTGFGSVGQASGSHFIRSYGNGTSSELQVDGSATETGGAGTNTASLVTIGAAPTGLTPADITVGFYGLIAGQLTSDAQWAAFKSWAAGFYGVTVP